MTDDEILSCTDVARIIEDYRSQGVGVPTRLCCAMYRVGAEHAAMDAPLPELEPCALCGEAPSVAVRLLSRGWMVRVGCADCRTDVECCRTCLDDAMLGAAADWARLQTIGEPARRTLRR